VTDLVLYHDTHLELTDTPVWDQAVRITRNLDVMGRNVQWWWGDWLNLCEEIFGEKYAQLIPDVGWDPKTLQNWKWVASRITPVRRLAALSWSHHEAVAGLEPDQQDNLLAQAEVERWTVREIRGAARELIGKLPKPKEPKAIKIKVKCPECEAEFECEVS